MALVSAPSLTSRFTQLVLAAFFLLAVSWFWLPSLDISSHLTVPSSGSQPWRPHAPAAWVPNPSFDSSLPPVELKQKENHPIDRLVEKADQQFASVLAKETKTLRDTAQAYRDRRGRQPPPGFDRWFAFAQEHSAVFVEDFFDRIYDDLNPFWALPAQQIREQANDFIHRISVRDGKTEWRTDIEEREWMNLWKDLVQSVAQHLPDLDMPINVMDESRMVVPWEEINGYMEKERENRRIVPEAELKTSYGNLRELDTHPPEPFVPDFNIYGPYWPLAVVGCPPESPARKAYIENEFTTPPPLPTEYPPGSYEGYVQNWTLAKSACDNAALQGLHGTFIEPVSISNTKKLFPLFGGSKLPMNNEILLPAAMYWTDDPFYSGGHEHGESWETKKDGLIWRGAASGGRNKEENWTRFQRHRFVSTVNATSIWVAETTGENPPNFLLPTNKTYDIATFASGSEPGALSDWTRTWSDAAMVHLICFPDQNPPHCPYTDPFFAVEKPMPMQEQYGYKYLPDIDGNSFSGRYRGFLGSTSVPIKATIYEEWHDSRLVPWKHFVPMDNTFVDIYGIMEYFVGNKKAGIAGHDEVAQKIAQSGKDWAEKVLRKEDMQVYVLRLLLEYARLCDDDREVMGWRDNRVG